MRRIIAALLLGVTAATPLIAQPGDPRRDRAEFGRDRGDTRGGRPDANRDWARERPDPRGNPAGGADRRGDIGQDRRDDRRDWQGGRDDRRDPQDYRRDDDRRDRQNYRRDDDRRGWAGGNWNGGRPGDNGRPGNNGWQGNGGWNDRWRGDNRYDWQRSRLADRGFYTLPRYYGPQGFGGYRRWGVGGRIGQPFYARSYWLADPYAYRLPPAYGNYRWVRYYDDVLLVDILSGVVRDALYGFFY